MWRIKKYIVITKTQRTQIKIYMFIKYKYEKSTCGKEEIKTSIANY